MAESTKAWAHPQEGDLKNLYLGFGAEYMLMASLSRHMYDVMKLQVDYGFDVLATSPGWKNPEEKNQYFFQVKSVNITEKNDRVKNSNDKTEFLKSISISEWSLSLLEEKKNDAALFVYVFDEVHSSGETGAENIPVKYFWMTYEDIEGIKDEMKPGDSTGQGGHWSIPVKIVYADDGSEFYICVNRKGDTDFLITEKQNPERFKVSGFLESTAGS